MSQKYMQKHEYDKPKKQFLKLSKVLMKNGTIPDMVGYLSVEDMPDVSICICAEKELGFFIAIVTIGIITIGYIFNAFGGVII